MEGEFRFEWWEGPSPLSLDEGPQGTGVESISQPRASKKTGPLSCDCKWLSSANETAWAWKWILPLESPEMYTAWLIDSDIYFASEFMDWVVQLFFWIIYLPICFWLAGSLLLRGGFSSCSEQRLPLCCSMGVSLSVGFSCCWAQT